MPNHECFWQLSTLSDQELESRLASLVSSERSTTARLAAHLAEVLERRLHPKQAYASMTAYCREKLQLKEDDAGRRIAAARLGTRYPAVFSMLDSGELTLSVACKLKHYINQENHQHVLEGVRGRSYREAETWLAGKFPRVDVPSRVRRLPSVNRAHGGQSMGPLMEKAASAEATGPLPAPPTTSTRRAAGPEHHQPELPGSINPPPPRPRDRGRVEPLSPARYRVEFTAGEELKAKLELARDLMSHSNSQWRLRSGRRARARLAHRGAQEEALRND